MTQNTMSTSDKPTNLEKLRKMSAEEMALFISDRILGCRTCPLKGTCSPKDPKSTCEEAIARWLNTPAED